MSALLAAMALPSAVSIPLPTLACTPNQQQHAWVAPGSVTVETGLVGTFGAGITIVFESSIDCDAVPVCTGTITIFPNGFDADGDGINEIEPIVLPPGGSICQPDAVPNVLPGSDDDFEFGIGGAFFPADHHSTTFNVGYMLGIVGDFVFGSDIDNDGVVDGSDGSPDCYESYNPGTNPYRFTTGCASGADGGWWTFFECTVRTGDDGSFTTNGPLITIGEDENGLPTVDVNEDWNPVITPPTTVDPSVDCSIGGHMSSDDCVTVNKLVFEPPLLWDGEYCWDGTQYVQVSKSWKFPIGP